MKKKKTFNARVEAVKLQTSYNNAKSTFNIQMITLETSTTKKLTTAKVECGGSLPEGYIDLSGRFLGTDVARRGAGVGGYELDRRPG